MTNKLDNARTLLDWLDDIETRQNILLSIEMKRQLVLLADLLVLWNQKINLTSVIDAEGIAVKHYLDSLSLLPWLEKGETGSNGRNRLIDVGTGAGFPGLVLKIARPDMEVCLMDALAKRVGYLNEVICELGLKGITTVHARAEHAGKDRAYREQFDFSTARAVAALPVLCEYCLPFVRVGGRFLAMKTDVRSEWPAAKQAVELLGGRAGDMRSFFLPGTDIKRAVLEFIKEKPTPKQFPRKAGKPQQQPL